MATKKAKKAKKKSLPTGNHGPAKKRDKAEVKPDAETETGESGEDETSE
jgi:hypothetical protein